MDSLAGNRRWLCSPTYTGEGMSRWPTDRDAARPMPEIPVSELAEAIRGLRRASVLVVGEAMLECHLHQRRIPITK